MKKSFAGIMAVVAFMTGGATAQVVDFDDITFWVGSGANRAGLVIDFHNGGSQSAVQESWVWGYRWDGVATGFDMLSAVSSADISLTVDSPGFLTTATYVVGLNTYQGVSDFVFDDVSWGYYIAGGSSVIFDSSPPFGPTGTFNAPNGGMNRPSSAQWSISTSGSADRTLADGSWDAWSFGAYDPVTFDHLVPPSDAAYAAIPEPGAGVLVLVGAAVAGLWRRTRART